MNDAPTPDQLLAAVAAFLRGEAAAGFEAAGQGALAYQSRVAANILAIVQRQLALAPAADAAELARLRGLLEVDGGDLRSLTQRLAVRLADGTLPVDAPGLADHLWCSTLAKLAVDQPGYSTVTRLATAKPDHSPREP